MSEHSDEVVAAYVETAAQFTAMPLKGERFAAVTAVMKRIALFAADVAAVELANDVEIAGVFYP